MESHFENSEDVSTFSSGYADEAIDKAFTHLRGSMILSDWCDDVAKRTISLSIGYCKLSEQILNSAECDAFAEYEQYCHIVHHLAPYANKLAEHIIRDAINIHSYCQVACENIMEMVKEDISVQSYENRIEMWAERKALKIQRSGLAKYFRKKCVKRPKVSDCSSTG